MFFISWDEMKQVGAMLPHALEKKANFFGIPLGFASGLWGTMSGDDIMRYLGYFGTAAAAGAALFKFVTTIFDMRTAYLNMRRHKNLTDESDRFWADRDKDMTRAAQFRADRNKETE